MGKELLRNLRAMPFTIVDLAVGANHESVQKEIVSLNFKRLFTMNMRLV